MSLTNKELYSEIQNLRKDISQYLKLLENYFSDTISKDEIKSFPTCYPLKCSAQRTHKYGKSFLNSLKSVETELEGMLFAEIIRGN